MLPVHLAHCASPRLSTTPANHLSYFIQLEQSEVQFLNTHKARCPMFKKDIHALKSIPHTFKKDDISDNIFVNLFPPSKTH